MRYEEILRISLLGNETDQSSVHLLYFVFITTLFIYVTITLLQPFLKKQNCLSNLITHTNIFIFTGWLALAVWQLVAELGFTSTCPWVHCVLSLTHLWSNHCFTENKIDTPWLQGSCFNSNYSNGTFGTKMSGTQAFNSKCL